MFETKPNKIFILVSFTVLLLLGVISCVTIAHDGSKTQAMIGGIGSAKADFSRAHLIQESVLTNSLPKICLNATCKIVSNAGIFNVGQVTYSSADDNNYAHDAITEDKFKYCKNIISAKIFEDGRHIGGLSYDQDRDINLAVTKQQKEVRFLKMHGNWDASGLFSGLTGSKTGDEIASGISYQISEIYLI